MNTDGWQVHTLWLGAQREQQRRCCAKTLIYAEQSAKATSNCFVRMFIFTCREQDFTLVEKHVSEVKRNLKKWNPNSDPADLWQKSPPQKVLVYIFSLWANQLQLPKTDCESKTREGKKTALVTFGASCPKISLAASTVLVVTHYISHDAVNHMTKQFYTWSELQLIAAKHSEDYLMTL